MGFVSKEFHENYSKSLVNCFVWNNQYFEKFQKIDENSFKSTLYYGFMYVCSSSIKMKRHPFQKVRQTVINSVIENKTNCATEAPHLHQHATLPQQKEKPLTFCGYRHRLLQTTETGALGLLGNNHIACKPRAILPSLSLTDAPIMTQQEWEIFFLFHSATLSIIWTCIVIVQMLEMKIVKFIRLNLEQKFLR